MHLQSFISYNAYLLSVWKAIFLYRRLSILYSSAMHLAYSEVFFPNKTLSIKVKILAFAFISPALQCAMDHELHLKWV